MDWAESEELMEIYLTEVDQRSESLIDGARALIDGSLEPRAYDDLVRDAHTLKGSSAMVGRTWVGSAAAALERAWKQVRETNATRLPVLGSAMLDLTAFLAEAARAAEPVEGIAEAESRLDAVLTGVGEAVLGAGEGGTDVPADSLMTPDPRPESAAIPATEPSHSDAATPETTLGGLLPALEADLAGAVMRVDTGSLYALINRIAEIGIELESLDDLSLVTFDNESRISSAWKAQIERVVTEVADLQSAAVSLVTVPFVEGVETFPQFVRFLSRRLDREVRFETAGVGISVDRQIVELLREPLRHLVVNAVDHGIEPPDEREAAGKPRTGTVRLSARLDRDRLEIAVSDDGRGIDWDAVRRMAVERGLPTSPSELRGHLLSRGFTTSVPDGEFSGTGEGLALLGDAVDRLAGSVMIDTSPGKGTTIFLDVPASLVLQRIVSVSAGDQIVGIPEASVIDVVDGVAEAMTQVDGELLIDFDGELIPFIDLSEVIGDRQSDVVDACLVLSTRSGAVAVGVRELFGERRLAVKGLGPILEGSSHVAGAAFLGGGQVLVVLDHNYLGKAARTAGRLPLVRPRVLVVDDSAGVRQLIATTLRGNGFEVSLANDAEAAHERATSGAFDALIVDYSMPGSNGAQLVRRLRADGIRSPIVMVSGVADDEEKAAAWEAGVDAYLDKYDVRRGALVEAVQRLIEDRWVAGG